MTHLKWRVRGLLLLAAALAAPVVMAVDSVHALPLDPIEPPEFEDLPDFFVRPSNGFAWRVPSRFGQLDGRGIIDYHWNERGGPKKWDGPDETYDPAYVRPSEFPADFDGCPTAAERDLDDAGDETANTYIWTVEDPAAAGGTATISERSCSMRHTWSAEGTYRVALTIQGPDGQPFEGRAEPYEQWVEIEDLLIVSLGDSYGSGEGNPDRPAVTYDNGEVKAILTPAVWQDRRCHRSAKAGPAQSALELERSDAHSSVTFISFACSGATIDTPYFDGAQALDPYHPADPTKPLGTGVLGPYMGAEPPQPSNYADKVPSQVDQLVSAVGNRRIDALIISGGGNDIGFGPVAAVCTLYGDCVNHLVWGKSGEGPRPLHYRFGLDLAALGDKYDDLAAELADSGLNIGEVLLTQYPDSTRDDDGSVCDEMLEDVIPAGMAPLLALAAVLESHHAPLPWYHIDAQEAAWASGTVLPGLNGAVEAAAARHGWTFVDGISDRFAGPGYGHGYCAENSWIRRASDSIAIQGPYFNGLPPDTTGTKGTLHPTAQGHQAYRERISHYLRPLLLDGVTPPPAPPAFSTPTDVAGWTARHGAAGWLVGRCSDSGCDSDAAVAAISVSHPAGLRGATIAVNGAANCALSGVTCTPSTTVTADGTIIAQRWDLHFTADGVYRFDVAVSGVDGASGSITREIKVDLHDPDALPAVVSPIIPASGWHTGPVELSLAGGDGAGGSGIAAFEYELDGGGFVRAGVGDVVRVSANGTHQLVVRPIDWAGRAGTALTTTVRIDATAPMPTCDSPDGTWHADNVTVNCTIADGDSGVVGETVFALSTAVADGHETASAATNTRQVCDVAGNCTTVGPIGGHQVDRRQPTIAVVEPADGATIILGTPITASFQCADGGSGIASCTGTTANGQPLDTSRIGSHELGVDASDNVGHTTSTQVAYTVRWDFSGFLAPVDASPTVNAVKAGRTIPVKFSLDGDQGLAVLAGAPTSQQISCDRTVTVDGIEETVSSSVSGLTYDAATDTYTDTWKTARSWEGTCRQLVLKLADGTAHHATFQFN